MAARGDLSLPILPSDLWCRGTGQQNRSTYAEQEQQASLVAQFGDRRQLLLLLEKARAFPKCVIYFVSWLCICAR
jgi:hypothetical protein